MMMVYGENDSEPAVKNIETPMELQRRSVLSDPEITKLAKWAVTIEEHYKCPMDIEWAKDGWHSCHPFSF